MKQIIEWGVKYCLSVWIFLATLYGMGLPVSLLQILLGPLIVLAGLFALGALLYAFICLGETVTAGINHFQSRGASDESVGD